MVAVSSTFTFAAFPCNAKWQPEPLIAVVPCRRQPDSMSIPQEQASFHDSLLSNILRVVSLLGLSESVITNIIVCVCKYLPKGPGQKLLVMITEFASLTGRANASEPKLLKRSHAKRHADASHPFHSAQTLAGFMRSLQKNTERESMHPFVPN